jgi:hypothetical protein
MRFILSLALALFLLAGEAAAQRGANTTKILSAASNNSTLIKNTGGNVQYVIAVNTTATLYYLKLYDKASAPTCGTDVPVFTAAVPALATGGPPLLIQPTDGIYFANGIGVCLTAAVADNDNTNAATGVQINVGWR